MQILQAPVILAFACVLFFYGAGKHESRNGGSNIGFLWAALSAALSALVIVVLDGTWGWLVLAQVGLFLAIGVVRAVRDP